MRKPRFLIFGSCVSRDIFRFGARDFEIVKYYARSSVISLVSNPMQVTDEDITQTSGLHLKSRMVEYDFTKCFWNDLQNLEYDFILLDFIDERLDLIEVDGNFYTYSTEFASTNLFNTLKFDRRRRSSPSIEDLWFISCDQFVEQLLPYRKKLILHETYHAEKYYEEQQLKDFEKVGISKIYNNHLIQYKEYFTDIFPLVHILEHNPRLAVADAKHIWGLSPVHYLEEYYLTRQNEIRNIAGKIL